MSVPTVQRSKPLTAKQQEVCEELIPLAKRIARDFSRLEDAESEALLGLCQGVRDWFARNDRPCTVRAYVARAIRNRLTDVARKDAPPTETVTVNGQAQPRKLRFLTFREG